MFANEEHVLEDAYEIIKLDPDYKQTKEEIVALSREIIEKLASDYNLFLRLEELFYHAKDMRLRQVYALGLRDGQA